MKKLFLQSVILIVSSLFITSSLVAQSPQGIPYQAVMRNADGSVMASSPVNMTFMIHDGTADGTVVYQESHSLTSNTQGLVSCVVGSGVVLQGNFSNINWGGGAKFLHVMMNGTDLGTQQMLSVPFVLYADEIPSRVSAVGDSLWVGDEFVIVPGISAANYPVLGCTDIAACNYNISATVNDNSCLYQNATCDDGDGSTINDVINGNCQCVGILIVSGCTNPQACNYNAASNVDNGSCLIQGADCDDGNSNTVNDVINGSCQCVGLGGSNFVVINEIDADNSGIDNAEFIELYGSPNMSLNGFSLVLFNGTNDLSYSVYDLDGYQTNTNGFFVLGSVANADYVVPSGTSGFIQNGADAVGLYLSDSAAWAIDTMVNNVGLVDAVVYGTEDPTDAQLLAVLTPGQTQLDEGPGNNTNSLSRVPDGGAALTLSLFVAQGPTPGSANYDLGCTNSLACNFNPLAITDDGSCQLIGSVCDDGLLTTVNDSLSADCQCIGDVIVLGCVNPIACNYNSEAIIDDGTCLIIGASCNDNVLSTINDFVDSNCHCAGTLVSVGCTNSGSCNFDSTAVVDDGTCILEGDVCDSGYANVGFVIVDCICTGISFSIGQNYQGGKVAYIFQPGDLGYVQGEVHGIIAASQDLPGLYSWGCWGGDIDGAGQSSIGYGMINTNDIVNAGCGGAAQACLSLVLNGFDDWFLPSFEELKKLYSNKSLIGGFQNSFQPPTSYYWSSTESNPVLASCYSFYFGGGNLSSNKNYAFYVRPIRYF